MKIIGIIPARYGSTRFPGKPLVKISGKSLIRRVYEQSVKAGLDKVIVATDDQRIIGEVNSFGGNVKMTGEHPSGTDRIAEAAHGESCDAVINIQGDEPLIDPEIIGTIASALRSNPWAHVTTAACVIDDESEIDNPNVVKTVIDNSGRALYFSRSRIPFNRKPADRYLKHIGIYGYRKDFLEKFVSLEQSSLEKTESLEQLRAVENGYSIHVSVLDYKGIAVDVPEDVEAVERIIGKM